MISTQCSKENCKRVHTGIGRRDLQLAVMKLCPTIHLINSDLRQTKHTSNHTQLLLLLLLAHCHHHNHFWSSWAYTTTATNHDHDGHSNENVKN